jgi:hypothetical protein
MKGLLLTLLLLALCHADIQAGRIYGTGNWSWQHIEQLGDRIVLVQRPGTEEYDQVIQNVNSADDLNAETVFLNYEDVLWYKNRLRISAYLSRREMGFSDTREFRPTYSAELRSYGYFISSSYSPYTQRAVTQTGTGLVQADIIHRDWRNTLALSYPKMPTLAVVFNRNESHDAERSGRIDGETRNFLVETGYTWDIVSARVNYSNLRQESRQEFPFVNTQRSYTGTASTSHQLGKLGFFSSNYTYYNTRNTREVDQLQAITRTTNHSATAMLSSQEWRHLVASASYSGRFGESKLHSSTFESENQSYAGQLSYRPFGYLSFDLTKAYQLNRDRDITDINENLSLATTLTRALRRGIDTRMTVSRIWVQQAPIVSSTEDEQYTMDTYYASLSFEPYGFVRTLFDASVVHNSEPSLPEQRYQMNMSMNSRFYLTRTLEGRFTMTALYQGADFEIGRSFSQNINIGGSFTPQSNMTMNVNYLYTTMNASEKITSGTWIGYASYSFRRAFTLSASANRQEQEATSIPLVGTPRIISLTPYTINGQIQMNLSGRTTLTTAYIYTETPTRQGQKTIDRSVQVIVNVQI